MSIKVQVRRRTDIADGVVAFEFVAADGSVLPPWEPGAHVDVVLPSGMVRQYSLTGDSTDQSCYRVAVLRQDDGRGGSAELCSAVAEGDVLTIDGPRNHFHLEEAERYCFVAGGIGITPIAAMIEQLTARGHNNWSLLYGGRSRTSMAFLDELGVHPDQVVIHPVDEVGHLDLSRLSEPQPGTLVYCCGPEPLLTAVSETMSGWTDRLHFERFSPGEVVTEGPDAPFDVELEQSGLSLKVPADKSILDVVLEVLPDYEFSCADGTCGTCEARVLKGTPDHRDWVLTEEEQEANDRMMICVSRSRTSSLTLDL